MIIEMFDEEKDVSDFLRLFEISFDSKISREYFYWKYANNPFRIDEIPIIVARDNNETVAIYGFQPSRMVFGEENFSVLQGVDAAVIPQFRGKGVFTAMKRFAIDKFRKSGYRIFYGHPNNKSLSVNLKSGWEAITPITWHWKLLNPQMVISSITNNYIIQKSIGLLSLPFQNKFKIPGFQESAVIVKCVDDPGILENIFNQWNSRERVCTVRDLKYLNWRFKSHPEKKYSFYISQVGGEVKGYFILKIEDFRGMKRGSIVDYILIDDHPDLFKSLLIYSLNLFKDEGCHVVDTWAFTQDWAKEVLEKCGFISSRNIILKRWFSNTHMLARAIDKSQFSEDLSRMKWYLTPSDSDLF